MTPEDAARQTGYTLEEWRQVEEVLGVYWTDAAETVAHLAVRGRMGPLVVARILVGGSGFPGILATPSRF